MAIIKNIITGHSFTCRNERVIEHCRKDIKTFVIEEEPQKKTKTATKATD